MTDKSQARPALVSIVASSGGSVAEAGVSFTVGGKRNEMAKTKAGWAHSYTSPPNW